jgi:hypothetical protein
MRAIQNGRGTLLVLGSSLVVVVILAALVMATISRYAQRTDEQVQGVQSVLDKQKVCGNTSQEFCRDLFERLADNISHAQRIELACTVARFTTAEIIPGVKCPEARR